MRCWRRRLLGPGQAQSLRRSKQHQRRDEGHQRRHFNTWTTARDASTRRERSGAGALTRSARCPRVGWHADLAVWRFGSRGARGQAAAGQLRLRAASPWTRTSAGRRIWPSCGSRWTTAARRWHYRRGHVGCASAGLGNCSPAAASTRQRVPLERRRGSNRAAAGARSSGWGRFLFVAAAAVVGARLLLDRGFVSPRSSWEWIVAGLLVAVLVSSFALMAIGSAIVRVGRTRPVSADYGG